MSKLLDHPAVCFVCKRRSDGYAVGDTHKSLGWYCLPCFPIVKKAFEMKAKAFDGYEEKALDTAGEKAGTYLDSIGKTDLAQLSEAEWKSFLEAAVKGFGDGMRAACAELEPPF